MNADKKRERDFIDDVEKTLRQRGEKLPPEVVVQLSAIRSVAVASRASAFASFWRLVRMPVAASMVAVGLFAMIIVAQHPPAEMGRSVAGLEDMEILIDVDSPDFYTELDFYNWLAEADRV